MSVASFWPNLFVQLCAVFSLCSAARLPAHKATAASKRQAAQKAAAKQKAKASAAKVKAAAAATAAAKKKAKAFAAKVEAAAQTAGKKRAAPEASCDAHDVEEEFSGDEVTAATAAKRRQLGRRDSDEKVERAIEGRLDHIDASTWTAARDADGHSVKEFVKVELRTAQKLFVFSDYPFYFVFVYSLWF